MKNILNRFTNVNFKVKSCILSTLIYILVQVILTGELRDGVFDGLLLVGTLFLIVQMDRLCLDFKNNSHTFYINLYNNSKALENRDEDVKMIFNNKLKIYGVFYGLLVGLTVFLINRNYLDLRLNVCLSIYLCFMNFFTGIAISILIQYFKISKKWMNNISFVMPTYEKSEIVYVRKIRNKVLFIAIIYCFFSQLSVLFSSIHINSLIYFLGRLDNTLVMLERNKVKYRI